MKKTVLYFASTMLLIGNAYATMQIAPPATPVDLSTGVFKGKVEHVGYVAATATAPQSFFIEVKNKNKELIHVDITDVDLVAGPTLSNLLDEKVEVDYATDTKLVSAISGWED